MDPAITDRSRCHSSTQTIPPFTDPTQTYLSAFLSWIECVDGKPSFDSQAKESSTTTPPSRKNKDDTWPKLSKLFLKKKILSPIEDGRLGIVEEVVATAHGRQHARLWKSPQTKTKLNHHLLSIPKLDDAHKAGSSSSSKK